jgi:hypothetical protein
MDSFNTYQSSFATHEEKKKPSNRLSSFIFLFSLVIFITACVLAAFSFGIKKRTEIVYTNYQNSFRSAEERLKTGLPISNVTELNTRLGVAQKLLATHKSFVLFFDLLERVTLTNVQFTSFSYSEKLNNQKNVVQLTGYAPDYKSVAEQSEQFSQDKETKRYFSNLVFTNLDFNSKEKKPGVNFEVTFNIEPELLDYNRSIANSANDSAALVPAFDTRPNSIIPNNQ